MAIVKTHFKPTGTPAEREAYALHVHGLEVVNNTGSSIAAGKLVYVSGWSHTLNLPKISLADADVVAGSATFVTPGAIPDGQTGFVEKSYTLEGVNTTGSALGDPVYLSTTAGTWTLTAPTTAGAIVQVVGRVDVHDSASAGVVKIVLDAGSITSLPLTIGGTSVTATAAELNYNDRAGAVGVVEASKTVVAGASKEVGPFGDVTIGTVGTVGNLYLSDGANPEAKVKLLTDPQSANLSAHIPDPGNIVDAYVALSTAALTAAEVDVLDGVTPGTNAASKAVVAGSDGYIGAATFDGAVTLGVNGVGGVAGSLVIKDGANPGASSSIAYADLAQVQGITPGTSAASKAVVLGADSKINALDITTLTLNGTAVTTTAAQLNALGTTQGGLAAILAAGLGGSHSVIKSETGTHEVVAAHATKDRACLVVATVDEEFNTGDTSRTIITVGEADTPDKMWAATKFPSVTAAGTVFVGAFTNTATKAITITSTAAAGTGTGGLTVAVIAIPTT